MILLNYLKTIKNPNHLRMIVDKTESIVSMRKKYGINALRHLSHNNCDCIICGLVKVRNNVSNETNLIQKIIDYGRLIQMTSTDNEDLVDFETFVNQENVLIPVEVFEQMNALFHMSNRQIQKLIDDRLRQLNKKKQEFVEISDSLNQLVKLTNLTII